MATCSEKSVDTCAVSKALQKLVLTGVTALEKELGRGAYGKVFTVKYCETVYAAKEIHSLLVESANPEEKESMKANFLEECRKCSVLNHPNIVRFIGLYYQHNSLLPVMVMELMDGSLTNYMEKSLVDFKAKCLILHDVASGLDYLHSRRPPVIHRDLSPNNILISHDLRLVAKISDLGVAKVVKADSRMTKSKLTQAPGCIDFMPPEALECNPVYSVSLDIFSYGGIMLFVMNQEWPSPESQVKFNPKTDKLTALSEVERRQKHLDKMNDEADVLKSLIKACLNNNPRKRPKVSTMFKVLEPLKVIVSSDNSTATEIQQQHNLPYLYTIQCGGHQWPIIYRDSYNINFIGIEKLQSSFDTNKWRSIHQKLVDAGMLKKDQTDIVKPPKVKDDELLYVHTQEYLDGIQSSASVARNLEISPLAYVPYFLIKKAILNPLRKQTSGTILAGKLAKDRGWAINIGGGFHHCCSTEGGGFCIFADISLCVKFILQHLDGINKVFILDLDAHQGNGFQRDLGEDDNVYIFDVYNHRNYPADIVAKAYIDVRIELPPNTKDVKYLQKLNRYLPAALDDFKPDMVIYNAGTAILQDDPLGHLDITDVGIRDRDEFVFSEVKAKRGIPIVMLTSGGLQKRNAEVTANSIINLYSKGLISRLN